MTGSLISNAREGAVLKYTSYMGPLFIIKEYLYKRISIKEKKRNEKSDIQEMSSSAVFNN